MPCRAGGAWSAIFQGYSDSSCETKDAFLLEIAQQSVEVTSSSSTAVAYAAEVSTFAFGTNAGPEAETAAVLADFEADLAAAVSGGWAALVENVTGDANASAWLAIDAAASLDAVAASYSNFTSPSPSDDDGGAPWDVFYGVTAAVGVLAVAASVATTAWLRRGCAARLKPARRVQPIIPEAKLEGYKPPAWAFD